MSEKRSISVVVNRAETDKGPRWILTAFDGDHVHVWPLIPDRGLLFKLKREPTPKEIDAFKKHVEDPFNVPLPSRPIDQ